jgi:PAS domain S-box-containing protein
MEPERLLDQMADSIVGCDRTGTINYANQAAGRLLGRDHRQLFGAMIWEFLSSGAGDSFRQAIGRVVAGDDVRPFELFDASRERWTMNHVHRVDDRLYLVSRDLTEQKRAAGRLEILAAASRAFSDAASDVRTVFENIARHVAEVLGDLCAIRLLSEDGSRFEAPVGIWDVDPACRKLLDDTPSVAASEAIGPELVQGGRPIVMANVDVRAVASRIAPSRRREVMEQLAIHSVMLVPLMTGGRMVGLLSVARREAGTSTPYGEDDLLLVQELADRAAMLVKQLRAHRMVENSRQRLAVIGDSLPALVSLVDREQRYQFVNATYRRWFGHEPASILGRTLEDVLGREAYQAIAPQVATALAGTPVSFQAHVPYAAGGHRDVQATYTPYIVDGTVEGFVALVVDVTETVRMQEALRAALATRDEFLSIASHELRTPLTTLGLQLEGLGRALARDADEWDAQKLRWRLGTALRQAERLTMLIDGLLNVSRISTGRLVLDLEDCDLAALVDEIVVRFEEEAMRAGSQITAVVAESRGRWDLVRLDQVLTNLLSNALKYGAARPVEVALVPHDDHVTLSVRDGGIGIAPDDLTRIFGQFERAAPSNHYGGFGLGLYIAAQIVRAHGGAIDVTSQPGQGTTFTVTLPRHTPRSV